MTQSSYCPKTNPVWRLDPQVAVDVGVEEALMYHNISFWCGINRKNQINFHEGKYWTFNSCTSFAQVFPFWTEAQIKRILRNLVKGGWIKKGRFNKKGYDKTNWYTSEIKRPIQEMN